MPRPETPLPSLPSATPPTPSGSLERRLPLLISALLLAVVVVFGWAAYGEARRAATATASEHLRLVAQQLAELSQASTAQRYATLRRPASAPAVVAAATGGGPTALAAADSVLRAALGRADSTHEAWELGGVDGVPRLSTGMATSPAERAGLRPTVDEALRLDSGRQAPVMARGDRVHIWTVVPVRDPASRRVVGFLAERRRVPNAAATDEAIRELTGQDVTVLVASPDGATWGALDGRAVAPPLAPPAALDTLGPTFTARGAAGGRVIGARAAVPGTPHVFVLTVAERDVLAGPAAFLRRLVGSGLAIVLLGAAGAWVLGRHVTRPLRALTDATAALAAGDYRRRVPRGRDDELGRLAGTFNDMAARIGDSHAELARRVDESTALAAELERRNHELREAKDAALRAVGRTQRLQSVTAALAAALEFDRVAAAIGRDGARAADATAGELYVANAERSALSLVALDGAAAPAPDARAIALDAASPVAAAARTGEPVFTPGDAESEAALPLVARGRPIGALRLRYAGRMPFDADARAFLDTLAQQCAQALDRALLYDAALEARRSAEDARHAAQAASQAKSAFLAMMSHELRTPLNAIAGYAELLDLGLRGPVTDAQHEDLVRIRHNQRHLLSIIDDILELSRIEAGVVTVEPEDVPLDALLGELDALVRPQVAARGVRYAVHGCDDALVARADRERLKQVLVNVVSNAVRFTEADGAVTIACRGDVHSVYLRVEDTGIGIPADQIHRIFEPFVQLDAGLTRRTGGTGLGLAISRDLMAAMGGRIVVESEVGRGSAFTLVLPRVAAARAGAPRVASDAGVR